jgi:uncharacterized coiled-coil protein SlyX
MLHTSGDARPARTQARGGSSAPICDATIKKHLGSEDTLTDVVENVANLLDDSICRCLWVDETDCAGGLRAVDAKQLQEESVADTAPDTMETLESRVAYVHHVLETAGFLAGETQASAARWQKLMSRMLSNAQDRQAEAKHLPWTAKYAPQAAEEVLANGRVARDLLNWLSKKKKTSDLMVTEYAVC